MANGKSSVPAGLVHLATKKTRKLIVPDTSVEIHDPHFLKKFGDNDIYQSRPVVAQLGAHKKGQTDTARAAREVIRLTDRVFEGDRELMMRGASLEGISSGKATGNLFYQMCTLTYDLPKGLMRDSADLSIIGVACALRRELDLDMYSEVVLVTKDTEMRYAALSVEGVPHGGIVVQDYFADRALLKDSDVLPCGYYRLTDEQFADFSIEKESGRENLTVKTPLAIQMLLNECVFFPNGDCYKVIGRKPDDEILHLRKVRDFMHDQNAVMGITALDDIQSIALDHLTDPHIDMVILLGDAGSGKTLLATAAGYHQAQVPERFDSQLGESLGSLSREMQQAHKAKRPHKRSPKRDHEHSFEQIIVTRPMAHVGGEQEQIGFLKGGPVEKFGPWVLAVDDAVCEIGRSSNREPVRSENGLPTLDGIPMILQPLGFIGGRTLSHAWIMGDEAQDLTPFTAKALMSRVGKGSKIVVMGNLAQINSHFLDERSSGLAYMVMRLRGDQRIAFVILNEVYRSYITEQSKKL